MLKRVVDFVEAEPAVIGGLFTALVALGVSFATHPSNEWAGAIQGVILAGAALLAAWRVRAVVYSPATVAAMKTAVVATPAPLVDFAIPALTIEEEAASRASVQAKQP